MAARSVQATDLLDQPELAVLLGWSESTLRAARAQPERNRKIDGLPAPIKLVGGRAPVWDRREVEAWLRLRRQPSAH